MENKNIALKIIKVMGSIKSVSKDGFNAFHKYNYVTDAAIVSELRTHMIKNNLICIPNQLSCVIAGDLTTLLVQYNLIDADSGESIATQVYGYGQDKGDKGVYKAATGAEKYFLLKTFLLPTDDDPEDEKEPRKRVTKDELETFDKSLPPKPTQPYIQNAEALTLFTMLKEKGINPEEFRAYLKERGIEGTNKIKKEDYTGIVEWIMKQERKVPIKS